MRIGKPYQQQMGGVVLEYLIITVFSGALALSVLHYLGEIFKERMGSWGESLRRLDMESLMEPSDSGSDR